MKIRSTILLILAAVILPAATQAQSQQGKGQRPDPAEMFAKMDTDESGTLSVDEVQGRMKEHFDEIDSDNDGELTKEELKAAREARMGQGRKGKLKEADTDGNGAISAAEAEAAGLEKLLENFTELDSDGDGEVTREELKAAREARKSK